jgi:hypothetical protein
MRSSLDILEPHFKRVCAPTFFLTIFVVACIGMDGTNELSVYIC